MRAALSTRYGITDRLEVEVKAPYVFREETIKNEVLSTGAEPDTREFNNLDIGDVEFAGHYQINRGRGGWPFFIGNLRVKSRTGEGPFDVERDAQGLETESPTGSGFWAVEPSKTAILPSDPAVFFANIGYVANIERDVNAIIKTQDILIGAVTTTVITSVGDVDPGDAIRGSFGFGFAINERASFSLGYKHTFVGETVTEVIKESGTEEVKSVELHVGALLLGLSYRLTDRTSVHVNVQAGITEDAPDVIVTFRLPISFDLF